MAEETQNQDQEQKKEELDSLLKKILYQGVAKASEAIDYVSKADIFVVIGTSLKVYPAAGFINYAHHEVPKFVIDPGEMEQCTQLGFTHFKATATEGMKMLLEAFKDL